jgi:hypothetical protein
MTTTARISGQLAVVCALLAGCGGADFQSNRVGDAANLRSQNDAIVLFSTVALHPHTKRGWTTRGKSAVSPTFLPVRLVDGKYERDASRKYFGPYLQAGEVRPYRVDAGMYLLVNAYYRFTDDNKRVSYRGPVFANHDNKPVLIRFTVKAGEVIDLGRLEVRLVPPLNRPRIHRVPNDRAEVDKALDQVANNAAERASLKRRLAVRPVEEIGVRTRVRQEKPGKS